MDKSFEISEIIKEKPKTAKSNFKKFLDVHSLKGFEDEETLRINTASKEEKERLKKSKKYTG